MFSCGRRLRGSNLQTGGVIVYTGLNYTGTFQVLGIGSFDFCKGQLATVGNDTIKSVRVPFGYKVTLYQHCGSTGTAITLVSDNSDLGSLSAQVSVVKVEATGVVVYTGKNYSGTSQTVPEGLSNWCAGGLKVVGNDTIQSIRVPAGFKVTLYQHCDRTGDTATLFADSTELGSLNLNVSTILVERCVVVYTGKDYSGTAQSLKEGSYNLCTAGLATRNDTIQSIKVPLGFKVTLHEHCDASGVKSVFTSDSTNLGYLNLLVSYITVEKCVVVFTGANYTGRSDALTPGRYDACSGQLPNCGNDTITSVFIPFGLKVTLYEHCGSGGNTLNLTASSSALGSLSAQVSTVLVSTA